MGRPKGSKNKKTKVQVQEQLQVQEKPVKKRRTRARIKKIVNNSNTEKIKNTLEVVVYILHCHLSCLQTASEHSM